MAAAGRSLGVIWAAYLLAPNKELELAAIQPGAKRTGQATAWPEGVFPETPFEDPPGVNRAFFREACLFCTSALIKTPSEYR
jgi:hypothetical protein